jgi:adenylylsulfate kinase
MSSDSTDLRVSKPVTRSDRILMNGHQPVVLWLTGLSGSGKSTLCNAIESRLVQEFKAHTYLLDGDIIRTGLNKDLSFSAADRSENIRRIGEVTHLFYDAGIITLTAFISPFRADRDIVRALLPEGSFVEVYVRCPLETCEERDPKGLYRKARAGLIPQFTGIDSPYEEPLHPELVLDTAQTNLQRWVDTVIQYLQTQQIIK